jgi:hypothetical protein
MLAGIVVFIGPFGLLAVPLSILVGEGLACYHFVVKDACIIVKEDYSRFAPRLWGGVGAIAFASWGAGYVAHGLSTGHTLLRWGEVGIVTSIAAAVTAWAIALRREDRDQVKRWGKTCRQVLRAKLQEVPA